MRLNKRELRHPDQTLGDIVATLKITRGDVLFLNECIRVLNETSHDPNYQESAMQMGVLFNTQQKLGKPFLTLAALSPKLFEEHWRKFCEDMAAKQKKYYREQMPELFDENGELKANPLDEVPDTEPVPVGEGPVTPSEDVTSIVDAESSEIEQDKVVPPEV